MQGDYFFESYLLENEKEVRMSAVDFTEITGKLYDLFTRNEYKSDIMTAFNIRNWSELTCGQRTFGAQVLFSCC